MRENNTVMEENRDRLNQGTHENNAIGNKVISKSKEIVGKGKVVGNNEENIRKAERENRKINKGKKQVAEYGSERIKKALATCGKIAFLKADKVVGTEMEKD